MHNVDVNDLGECSTRNSINSKISDLMWFWSFNFSKKHCLFVCLFVFVLTFMVTHVQLSVCACVVLPNSTVFDHLN